MKKILALALALLVFTSSAFAEATQHSQIETVKTLLESLFSTLDSGDYHVSCNTSGFIVRQSQKEFTDMLLSAYILDDQQIKSMWKESQTGLLDFYNSIYEFIGACGIENPNFLYMLTDPSEPDEGDFIFFAISNGLVVYDLLAE